MNTLPALVLAGAGVGLGHAVMPDHWLPLAVLSRARRYSPAKVLRLSAAAAVAHLLTSVLLGALVLLIGLQFRATVARHADLLVGGILIASGAVLCTLELRGKAHRHPDHPHSPHDHGPHDHGLHDRGLQDHGLHDRGLHDHGLHDRGLQDYGLHDHGPHDRGPHDSGSGSEVATVGDVRESRRSLVAGLLIPFGAAASPDLTILPVFLAAGALGAGVAAGTLASFIVATSATIVGLTMATAMGAKLLTASWIDRGANLLTAGTLVLVGALAAAGVI